MVNRTLILRHLLGWLIYISYELSLIEVTVGLNPSAGRYAIFYALNIGLFYFNAHVILDYAFFKTARPYLVAAVLILLEIFGYLYLKLWIEALLSGTGRVEIIFDRPHHQLWITNIWREIFYIGFSTAYWSTLYMVRFKDRNHVIERERLKAVAQSLEMENKYIIAENAYLQNQISPHLLFNSLNFIYNSVYKISEKAGKGVMLLAQVMRYSLVSSEGNRTVQVVQELAQINKLIELSHLRFGEELFVNVRKKGNLKDVQVLPLILITLVENMIKHGDLGERNEPGLIRIERIDNTLRFVTKNKKRDNYSPPGGGLGLRNIKRRLANFYQDRATLDIENSAKNFTVTLILHL